MIKPWYERVPEIQDQKITWAAGLETSDRSFDSACSEAMQAEIKELRAKVLELEGLTVWQRAVINGLSKEARHE